MAVETVKLEVEVEVAEDAPDYSGELLVVEALADISQVALVKVKRTDVVYES